jgi:hypothetical protein
LKCLNESYQAFSISLCLLLRGLRDYQMSLSLVLLLLSQLFYLHSSIFILLELLLLHQLSLDPWLQIRH